MTGSGKNALGLQEKSWNFCNQEGGNSLVY